MPHSMASFNCSLTAADVLSSTIAAGNAGAQHTLHHHHHNNHHQQQQQQHHHSQIHNHHHHQQTLHHQQQQQHHHNNNHHLERTTTTTAAAATAATAAATAFLVPASSTALQLDSPFLTATPHFVSSVASGGSLASHSAATANTSSASYTFVQIKREPCQVSEVTTSNNNCHQSLTSTTHHGIGGCGSIATAQSASSSSLSSSSSAAATSKTMSSSTLTTLVKIEASSPKVHELDKSHVNALNNAIGSNLANSSNNSVPIGIAVARKRPQESTVPPTLSSMPPLPSGLSNSSTLPLTQSLNKDMNCFGIRVADLGGVGAGCSNIYFTGNGDLMTGSTTAEELGLSAAGLQSVNRTPSTFWQYSNALPIESVISMSPATVGLQYSREASRGQVVLLPATATPLGFSNYPILCTPPTDPFQQAAAAFVWPSYIPQGSASATLQPPPNFLFPSMSPHSTLQATAAPSYATSLQLLGSNYLTAAAAAAAAAAATSTLCQHNQQTNSSSSSINLSLGGTPSGSSSTMSTSSSSSSTTRFMSLAATAQSLNDMNQTKSTQPKPLAPAPPTLTLTTGPSLVSPVQPPPLLLPPSALKLEEWSSGEFMATAAKTTTTTLTAAAITAPPSSMPSLQFETRDKLSTTTNATTNLLEVSSPAQALNLVRLPTPPRSANLETAAVAAACAPQLQHQLIFHTAANSPPTPNLLNLSATINRVNGTNSNANSTSTVATTPMVPMSTGLLNSNSSNFLNGNHNCTNSAMASITPSTTPLSTETPINFKISNLDTSPQIVVGVPRVVTQTNIPPISAINAPQMQDVNIQTDTPVCSEDENSTCPLTMQQQHHQVAGSTTIYENSANCTSPRGLTDEVYDDADTQHPLELTKSQNKELEATSNLSLVESMPKSVEKPLQGFAEDKYNETPPICDSNHINTAPPQATNPEDLTGLELLSNISTSNLIKSGAIRVKQEPLDHSSEVNMSQSSLIESNVHILPSQFPDQQKEQQQQHVQFVHAQSQRQTPPLSPHQPQIHSHSSSNHENCNLVASATGASPPPTIVEPLGGLKLLCALAEQRIQEEEEGQNNIPNTNDNTTTNITNSNNSNNTNNNIFRGSSTSPNNIVANAFVQPSFVTTSIIGSSYSVMNPQNSSFPSMQGLELPSPSDTRYMNVNGDNIQIAPKRKKRKHHSKSSKSSSSAGSSKKSARSSKKNKKKKRHKLMALGECSTADLDFDDPQLQQELQKAFQTAVEPNYQRLGKWPSAQEIFNIMESNMRLRLADITRQYRKKKRKLDEISKSKKKNKCSQLPASSTSPVISLVGNSSLSLGAAAGTSSSSAVSSSVTSGNNHLSSSPLCDYKFGNFCSKPLSTAGTSTNYLTSTSFVRFADSQSQNMHPQFPPPDLELDNDITSPTNNNNNNNTSTSVYKPVRLEPSTLAATADQRTSGSILRLAQKTPSSSSSTKKLPKMVVCKESKLKSRNVSEEEMNDAEKYKKIKGNHQQNNTQQSLITQPTERHSNPLDHSLMLTQEHLYRKETRVLTDMGGLFYAGIMKPLQPPDVYAITLDGERGNKSHIMSREEIFKDTILEVAPKSVECVPIGTRLCAYWSQQYRCLYPGRAIESESSDDGAIAQEFVSVEFDDGDSGRIRLQNIRFLLSDYPIVEYNDNPLYSLGKQKKNSSKSVIGGAGVDVDGVELLSQHYGSDDTFQQQHQQTITSTSSSKSAGDIYSATAQEIFAAKRSEKKRNKSLKKKSESVMTSNGCVPSSAGTTSGSIGVSAVDCGGRKHHKHKKHKKHKKHHHRKNLMEIGIASKSIDDEPLPHPPMYTASFINKSEHNLEEEIIQEQDAPNKDDEDNYEQDPLNTQLNEDSQMVDEVQMTTIKMESTTLIGSVKVKTEHLEIDDEDESTSNQMSEISDETKGDHNNSKGSKIAAFLPDRQLWGWMGNAHRRAGAKGKARKQFYKTIKRGKETISVGDCAVFLSTGRPDRPFIGNIESMWETKTKIKRVRVKWFYHPEEAKGCPELKYPGALFESPHVDQNDVQTISHRCEVLPFECYVKKFGSDTKQYQSIYDNNDTYYLAGKYLPIPGSTKVFPNIPLLESVPPTPPPPPPLSTQNITVAPGTQKKRKHQQSSSATKTKITILNINKT